MKKEWLVIIGIICLILVLILVGLCIILREADATGTITKAFCRML